MANMALPSTVPCCFPPFYNAAPNFTLLYCFPPVFYTCCPPLYTLYNEFTLVEKPPDYGIVTVYGYGNMSSVIITGWKRPRQVCGRVLIEVWRSETPETPKFRLPKKLYGNLYKKDGEFGVVEKKEAIEIQWFIHYLPKEERNYYLLFGNLVKEEIYFVMAIYGIVMLLYCEFTQSTKRSMKKEMIKKNINSKKC